MYSIAHLAKMCQLFLFLIGWWHDEQRRTETYLRFLAASEGTTSTKSPSRHSPQSSRHLRQRPYPYSVLHAIAARCQWDSKCRQWRKSLATLGQLLTRPLENDQRSTVIFANTILEYRGIEPRMQVDEPGGQKRRAGHRQEDIEGIARCMHRITNLWVTINQFIKEDEPTGKRGRRKTKRIEYTERCRLISLESIWYQRELTDDNGPFPTRPIAQAPVGWEVRAGKWLEPFLENRQVSFLFKRALEYDPHNEMWEKRLARYFFFHFRMNASAGSFNREIGKLLQTLSLPIAGDHPERNVKQRFEKALNRLTKDRQIDGWEYTEDIDLKSRGWLPTWLQQKVRIYIAPYRPLKAVENQENPS